jgi:transcriptional regulator with XRE-family HTH domain
MPPPHSDDHIALGRAIRKLRAELGISQEELAHRSGLDRSYMGGVERGERNLSYSNLMKVANALGVRTSELLAEPSKSVRGVGKRR